jgi:hypothetical protein
MACGSSTAKSHDLCTAVFLYTLIYDRIQEKYDRLRFPYFAVFRRTRSRTYTIVIRSHVLWRNTVVYGMYTVVYDIVYDLLRPYTESVTVDLGYMWWSINEPTGISLLLKRIEHLEKSEFFVKAASQNLLLKLSTSNDMILDNSFCHLFNYSKGLILQLICKHHHIK